MRATTFLAGLVASVAASPTLVERQFNNDPNAPCGRQAFGYGPPSVDANNFASNPTYQYISLFAPAPQGYTAAFRNQTGSSQQAGYMGYFLLETYNTTACAQNCKNNNGCTAFNVYFERDPLLNPADACPNPPATTNIKCAIYSQSVSQQTATNNGQYRDQFHVLIAGSDGFNQS